MDILGVVSENQLIFLLLILIIFGEFVMLTGGLILKIKEMYCCGRRTKKYLSGDHKNDLQSEYPGWEITLGEKNISKKELRKLCTSCVQNLSQRPLYPAGTLTKAFGTNLLTVRIFVTVKPSHYEENARSADTREDTEYYTWVIFDAKPLYSEKYEMSGSFSANNFYPLPATRNAVNSLRQKISDKGERKCDMSATVCGGTRLDNGISVNYIGIKRSEWQAAVDSGLLDEIKGLYSVWGSKLFLDYRYGKLKLAAWIKMPDCEMYEGHNDFAVSYSQEIGFLSEKIRDISDIIDRSK